MRPLPGSRVVFSPCPHVAERVNMSLSLLIKLLSHHMGPTLTTSSKPNYLPRVPSPNTLRLGPQHMNLWVHNLIPSYPSKLTRPTPHAPTHLSYWFSPPCLCVCRSLDLCLPGEPLFILLDSAPASWCPLQAAWLSL